MVRTGAGDSGNRDDYSGCGDWSVEPGILRGIHDLRVFVGGDDFGGRRAAGGDHVPALQRLARCGMADALLFSGAISVQANAFVLAVARNVAIRARGRSVAGDRQGGIGKYGVFTRNSSPRLRKRLSPSCVPL